VKRACRWPAALSVLPHVIYHTNCDQHEFL